MLTSVLFQAICAKRRGAAKIFSFYRVSQQVWNRLSNVCERSEHRSQKKCISLQKIALSAFFVNCKNEKGFLKQPFSIILCSYLFSKWRKDAQKSLFHFAVHQKRLKKQFLERNTFFHIFHKLR